MGDGCSLCPNRIGRTAMVTEDGKEYSCGDLAAYLEEGEGKNVCTKRPDVIRLWEGFCCSTGNVDYVGDDEKNEDMWDGDKKDGKPDVCGECLESTLGDCRKFRANCYKKCVESA